MFLLTALVIPDLKNVLIGDCHAWCQIYYWVVILNVFPLLGFLIGLSLRSHFRRQEVGSFPVFLLPSLSLCFFTKILCSFLIANLLKRGYEG